MHIALTQYRTRLTRIILLQTQSTHDIGNLVNNNALARKAFVYSLKAVDQVRVEAVLLLATQVRTCCTPYDLVGGLFARRMPKDLYAVLHLGLNSKSSTESTG